MILFTSSIYRSNEAPVDIDVTFHSPLTASRRQTVCKLLTVLDCLVLTYQGQICVCVCVWLCLCVCLFFFFFFFFFILCTLHWITCTSDMLRQLASASQPPVHTEVGASSPASMWKVSTSVGLVVSCDARNCWSVEQR